MNASIHKVAGDSEREVIFQDNSIVPYVNITRIFGAPEYTLISISTLKRTILAAEAVSGPQGKETIMAYQDLLKSRPVATEPKTVGRKLTYEAEEHE